MEPLRRKPGPVAAYDPVALDKSVRRYVQVAERNLASMEALGDQITPLLDRVRPILENAPVADVVDYAERVTVVYDRLVKAGLNLVKAVDELHRLQSFLGGGPDSRPDLSAASEVELRAIVVRAVRSLGITDLAQLLESSPSAG